MGKYVNINKHIYEKLPCKQRSNSIAFEMLHFLKFRSPMSKPDSYMRLGLALMRSYRN